MKTPLEKIKEKRKQKFGKENSFYGKHHTKEAKEKMGLTKKGKSPWNKGLTKKTDKRVKKYGLRLVGRKIPIETRQKESQILRKKIRLGLWKSPNYWKGKKMSNKHREKIRRGILGHIKRVAGEVCPMRGKNEKKILDKLEQKIKHKIIRQFECRGYFLDGYIPELKLAIEVDERPKTQERDIEREKIIKQELGCKFLRIKDYD